MSKVRLIRGDNLDVLPLLPDESVDSIVTDPPYGLSKEPDVAEVLTHWLAGDDYNHRGGGFMGKAWDSFVPGPSVWRECLRVLKPGGYFLCFAGSRTVDLMGISIRLAGFEIRDQMQWLYGSGFPKSMDVAKALDKMGEDGSAWEGWGTALKPAHEPIVVARKPFRGTVAANVLAHGTGAMNIDASRIAAPGETIGPGSYSDPANQEGVVGSDLGISGADKEKFQAAQIASVEKANAMGRFPANVVLAHHPECQPTREVVTERVGGGAKASKTDSTTVDFVEGYTRGDGWTGGEITTEVWDCHRLYRFVMDGGSAWSDHLDQLVRLAVRADRLIGSRIEGSTDVPGGVRPCSGREGSPVGCPSCLGSYDALLRRVEGGGRASVLPPSDALGVVLGLGPSPWDSHPHPQPDHPSSSGGLGLIVPDRGTGPSSSESSTSGAETPSRNPHRGEEELGERADSTRESSSALGDEMEGWAVAPCDTWRRMVVEVLRLVAQETPLIVVEDHGTDCAVRLLDEQSGILTSGKPAGGSGPHKAKASVGKGGGPALEGSADGSLRKEGVEYHLYGDSGGASRFFYCSKTSKAERNAGLPEGVKNDHPTVKPVRLMEYLVRLVTPPGGTVLDPYIGSGTTGIAAANLGFDCIGIDRDDEGTYIDLAAHRVRHAGAEVQKQEFVP